MTTHAHFAAFAETLADAARNATLPLFRSGTAVENKAGDGDFDPVTRADQEAERIIREHIKNTYPDHGILGEEHGFEQGTSAYTWVLDPVDGTRAFISGIPLWGTLIALHDGTQPVVGLMDQPYTGERFRGVDGTAFFARNGDEVTLSTSSCRTLKEAIFSTTTPDMFLSQGEQKAYTYLNDGARLTRLGCDCYAYCLLAAGTLDLVVEVDLKPYDIQALIPIIQGAGGVITDWRGGPADQGGDVVAAATPELHAEVLSRLTPLAK